MRKRGCLAIREISGRHTHNNLAKIQENFNAEFAIRDKICFTVTDRGSNFAKTFRHFSMEEADELILSRDDESNDNDRVFREINALPSPSVAISEADEVTLYYIPPLRVHAIS